MQQLGSNGLPGYVAGLQGSVYRNLTGKSTCFTYAD